MLICLYLHRVSMTLIKRNTAFFLPPPSSYALAEVEKDSELTLLSRKVRPCSARHARQSPLDAGTPSPRWSLVYPYAGSRPRTGDRLLPKASVLAARTAIAQNVIRLRIGAVSASSQESRYAEQVCKGLTSSERRICGERINASQVGRIVVRRRIAVRVATVDV